MSANGNDTNSDSCNTLGKAPSPSTSTTREHGLVLCHDVLNFRLDEACDGSNVDVFEDTPNQLFRGQESRRHALDGLHIPTA